MKKVNWKLVLSVVVAAEVIAFLLGGLCGLIFQSKTVFIAVTIIPTFTAIHCVYSLQSGEVLEGISKADAYAELLERAKNAAV